MGLTPEQIKNVAARARKGQEAKRRLELAPEPAQARDNQKIAQGIMARRRAKQKGYM